MFSLFLLVLAVGVIAAPAGAGEERQATATLHVVRLKPFTVRGVGFKANEKVVLRLTGAGTGTAAGKATAGGTVTLTVPGAAVTACSPYVLRAVGTNGSIATLRNVVGAACKPVATVDFGASVLVIGSHFQPGERLTVTLVADGTRTRPATASSKGSFQANFGALPLSNCSAYTLKIIGSKGSKFTKTQAAVPC